MTACSKNGIIFVSTLNLFFIPPTAEEHHRCIHTQIDAIYLTPPQIQRISTLKRTVNPWQSATTTSKSLYGLYSPCGHISPKRRILMSPVIFSPITPRATPAMSLPPMSLSPSASGKRTGTLTKCGKRGKFRITPAEAYAARAEAAEAEVERLREQLARSQAPRSGK